MFNLWQYNELMDNNSETERLPGNLELFQSHDVPQAQSKK